MNEGLSAEYDEANNWYPYDSEDKTLVGIWSDSYELVEDLALFNSEKLYFEFADSFDGRMFCPPRSLRIVRESGVHSPGGDTS